MKEKPAKFLGTGHQCKDGYCHQLSVIIESVETFIRIVGLYLGVVPPIRVLVFHRFMCVVTNSLNFIQFSTLNPDWFIRMK
jgi:hypothetical protein